MAYLDQTSPDQQDDRIVEEILRDGFAGLLKIENEINRIYENMATISDIEECKPYGEQGQHVATKISG